MRLAQLAVLLISLWALPAEAKLTSNIAYGPNAKQKLDVYSSGKPCPASGCPVLVYVHGGGWTNGSKNMKRVPIGESWSSHGAVVVSLDYRLTPEVMHPGHVQDIAAGIAWVHNNIARFGGDASRIFIMGHSAGAQLVALVATDPQYLQAHGLSPAKDLAGVMPVDTASYDLAANDNPFVERRIADAFGTDAAGLKAASPLQLVTPHGAYPPFILAVVQERATALAQTQALAAKLPNARVIARSYPDKRELQAHGAINAELADFSSPMTSQFARFVGVSP